MTQYYPKDTDEARAILSLPIHPHRDIEANEDEDWVLVGCMVQLHHRGPWRYSFRPGQVRNITAYNANTNIRRTLTAIEIKLYNQD